MTIARECGSMKDPQPLSDLFIAPSALLGSLSVHELILPWLIHGFSAWPFHPNTSQYPSVQSTGDNNGLFFLHHLWC